MHDEEEVAPAVEAGAEVIGINNRDLHCLEVDLAHRPSACWPTSPPAPWWSPSRASPTEPTCEELEEAGVDAILVGEALMRADDPSAAIRSLLGG